MDWVTSDLHGHHTNIIKYCNRPFISAKEMDEWLITNINKHVAFSDRLFFLGDFIFPGKQNFADCAKSFRNKINCRNIIFIYGNHDRKGRGNTNFTNLFAGCYDILEGYFENKKTVYCHYSLKTWHGSNKSTWHFYGHSHFSLPDDPNSLAIDVGVDAAAHYLAKDKDLYGKPVLVPENYRPLCMNDILPLMNNKKTINNNNKIMEILQEI